MNKTIPRSKKTAGFTDQERAAMKERILELKADNGDGEQAVLAKIAAFPEPDHTMAKRLHVIIKTNAPTLVSKPWYGMPAYANNRGKVVCFFQAASKFKTRYATLGFTDTANLDNGNMWPTAFALKTLTAAEEVKIIAIVKKAT